MIDTATVRGIASALGTVLKEEHDLMQSHFELLRAQNAALKAEVVALGARMQLLEAVAGVGAVADAVAQAAAHTVN